MAEQISLFDELILQAATTTTTAPVIVKVPEKTITVKPKVPEKPIPPKKIIDILDSVSNIEELEEKCNVHFEKEVMRNKLFESENKNIALYSKTEVRGWGNYTVRTLQNNVVRMTPNTGGEEVVNLLYVDENCIPWTARVKIQAPTNDRFMHTVSVCDTTISKSKWSVATRLQSYSLMQPKEEIIAIMAEKMPYTLDFCRSNNGDELTFLLAPQLEHLDKAGYVFARHFFNAMDLYYNRVGSDGLDKFNRLVIRSTSPGKIKNVFKTSAEVAKVLKKEHDIDIWDTYRILDKFGKLKADNIQQAYDSGLNRDDLKKINSILNKQYNGKPVFTFETLMNYLGRIDMYEAISRQEGLQLLSDYLMMCSQLEAEPKIDGDSLKREHDIMARNVRNKRNEQINKNMEQALEDLKKYDYSEDVFFVRGIRSYDDLLKEANQQHNCVASYGYNIANKKSLIYVLRERRNPDKSLVTIELSPDGLTVRQKYMAFNRPIHNKAITDFIDRWTDYIRDVNKEIVAPGSKYDYNIEEQPKEEEPDVEL